MNLNDEIRQLLASFSIPEDIAAAIAGAHEDVENSGIAPGIEIGEQAPNFELQDSHGQSIKLTERLNRGPVVLSFFRGAWCPVCNLQLAAFHRALPEIRELGAEILAVHPDAEQLLEAPPEGLSILSDSKQQVIRDYKLQFTLSAELQRIYPLTLGVDISQRNKDGSWNLPVPGSFVISQDGIVRRRHVHADFASRMEPSEVVEALHSLRP